MGLAILAVGHLEAVLVVVTPLAALPLTLPAGTRKSYAGVAYALVAAGAADGSDAPERRMGLAWAHVGERLLLATSERALKLTLDEIQAGRGFGPGLAGFVAMELNLDALRKDRYFQREFLFPQGPEQGRIQVALRQEAGHLVEVREGRGEPRGSVFSFSAPGHAAAGWEPEGPSFWPAFRRGLLEPIPSLSETPVAALATLPAATQAGPQDRYAVDFTKPLAVAGATPWEAGELGAWKALLARQPVPSWGYWLSSDGVRRLVFRWPQALDGAFLECCRVTAARRCGRASVVRVGDSQEIQVGPGLPALALRRAGGFLWLALAAKDLKEVPVPQPASGVIRWAKVNLGAVRAEGARWAKIEGPARPEQVRPFSDRVLGLLGWMPSTTAIAVERRQTASGWSERVTFGQGAP